MVMGALLPTILSSWLVCLSDPWGEGKPAATGLSLEALCSGTVWSSITPCSWVAISRAANCFSNTAIASSFLASCLSYSTNFSQCIRHNSRFYFSAQCFNLLFKVSIAENTTFNAVMTPVAVVLDTLFSLC